MAEKTAAVCNPIRRVECVAEELHFVDMTLACIWIAAAVQLWSAAGTPIGIAESPVMVQYLDLSRNVLSSQTVEFAKSTISVRHEGGGVLMLMVLCSIWVVASLIADSEYPSIRISAASESLRRSESAKAVFKNAA